MAKRRILKNTTRSQKVDALSESAEIFFYRLVMCADINGNYPAHPRLLRSELFPLKDTQEYTEAHILGCLEECERQKLVLLYENNYKKFVHIFDYDQRVDRERAVYPVPNAEELAAKRPPNGAEMSAEVEVEEEVELEKEKSVPLVFPFDNGEFKKAWATWLDYKKKTFRFKYKTQESHQLALKKIGDMADGDLNYAIHLIKHAMERQWSGFYHDKDYGKQRKQTGQSGGNKGAGIDTQALSELHRSTNDNS